ncbi:hypothetical protein FIBSPDRAFT_1037251 [Athelia psychrophila]|uniref:Uncharacterized protein n=1 Tax=Athelia psychrophila TaxID=1759441 RepID=A0A166UGL2_9AGAM|nr:hypothetical protein FIBSPDRAFT_1037251 [Fibularhizoctonia sp. CBS 109695]
MHPRNLHKRQNADLSSFLQEPTIAGLTGAATATASSAGAAASFLMSSGTANGVAEATAPPLVVGGDTVTLTTSPSSSAAATTSSPATSSAAATTSGSNQIPMGTVIGACIGAFAIFAAVISLAWCGYKRSTRRLTGARARGISNLDSRSNSQRMKKNSQDWNKLNEKEQGDVWAGMVPGPDKESSSKEIIAMPPPARTVTPGASTLDKLGSMFKKTPSMRSTDGKSFTSYGHDDFADNIASAQQIAQYHPDLAAELAKTVIPRPGMARADSSAVSWGGDTISGDDLNRSMNSPLLSIASEVMSPTFVNVNRTPTAVTSQPHRWESAEVMHYDDSHHPQNPFADVEEGTSSDRKSITNPFFNAQRSSASLQRLRSQSNPFTDDARSARSQSIDEDPENRMQLLIAALNITPEEVQQRARIASMHPSILSTGSAYEDDASFTDFPLPPTPSSGTSRATED